MGEQIDVYTVAAGNGTVGEMGTVSAIPSSPFQMDEYTKDIGRFLNVAEVIS